MKSDNFYDFENRSEYEIEPKYQREDLLSEDSNPILCDICQDGIRLIPYLSNSLICPRCMHIYNPAFDTIKHDIVETTIEEMQDTHSGTMSYVEDTKHEPKKTRINKKLTKDELPDYVKQEIDFIQWRPGYKVVKPDDKDIKLSSIRPK